MEQKKRPKRPVRQRKSDRMIHSGVTQEEIRCDHALAPFDHMAHQMDLKWGVDRLVELVTPEMAEKYGSAMAKLNAAIEAADPQQVSLRAGVCMRGMEAMDQAATQSGAEPASRDVWLVQADGREFGLLRDARAWQSVQEKRPGVRLITEREMVLAIEMYQRSLAGQMVEQVKDSFPKADVIKIPNDNLEDEIPF
jgi:glutamate 5-kinase